MINVASGIILPQLARGVLKLSSASIAVGVTGLSGPGADGSSVPVGTSFIALADKNSAWCMKLETGRENPRLRIFG